MIIDVINKSGSAGGNFVGRLHAYVRTRDSRYEPTGMKIIVNSSTKGGHRREVTFTEAELYELIENAWRLKLLQNVSIQD